MTTCRICKKSASETAPKRNGNHLAGFCSEIHLREFLRPYIPGELKTRGFPKRYWGANLVNLDGLTKNQQEIDEKLRDYVRENSARSLLISGPLGVGKSYRGVAVLGELSLRGAEIRYSTSKEFVEKTQNLYRDQRRRESVTQEELREELLSCNYLHFDDLGAEKITDFAESQLDALFDQVYRCGSPQLIVTTNLTLNQLADCLPRTTDRLAEMCEIMTMDGISRRLKGDQAAKYQLFYSRSRTLVTVSELVHRLTYSAYCGPIETDKFEVEASKHELGGMSEKR